MTSIDINCDLGESYGNFIIGNDREIFPLISSCNIACGFHGGDPFHIEKTIEQAILHGVQIGAHPAYPDLMGFGRRKMDIPLGELSSIIKYQVSALKGMVESKGAKLKYVKPHGALYNSMVKRKEEAQVVVQAVKAIDSSLSLIGLANSSVQTVCENMDVKFVAEAFGDRRYNPDGSLMARGLEGAVITDPELASDQVLSLALRQQVNTADGKILSLKPDSICVHGDNPIATDILSSIHKKLGKHGLEIQAFA